MSEPITLVSNAGPVRARQSGKVLELERSLDGSWKRVPSIFRLRLTGTGTIQIDARNSLGTITESVASYNVSGATDQIEFPYAGDDAVEIRAITAGAVSVEVI